jgi:hypothetical protein
MTNTVSPRYIGDGVYIWHDGYHFVLLTGSHSNPDNVVYLDPHVAVEVKKYIDEVNASQKEEYSSHEQPATDL